MGSFLLESDLPSYNNTVTTNQAYRMLYLRGGQAVVYNNSFSFPNSNPSIVAPTEKEGYNGNEKGAPHDWFDPVRTSWPAEDQANNSFFSGNTINGAAQNDRNFQDWMVPPDNIFIQEGRDYWTMPPSASTATTYPQPGPPSSSQYPASVYSKPAPSSKAFPYPHPLTNSWFTHP